MDPFSIVVGAFGTTEFALSGISKLRKVITGFSEATEVLQDVASNLRAIELSLLSLGELNVPNDELHASAVEDLRRNGVVEAVDNCNKACADFEKRLAKWTRHSGASKVSLRDRLTVGVWNRERVNTLQIRVQTCQAIVGYAVQSTQLFLHLRSHRDAHTAHSGVQAKLQTLEHSIQEHMDLNSKQQVEVREREPELIKLLENDDDNDDEDDNSEAQLRNAVEELRQQSSLLKAEEAACRNMASQARSVRANQDISDVETSENSRAIVGLPESVVGKMDQKIRGVTTRGESRAIVGVFTGNMMWP